MGIREGEREFGEIWGFEQMVGNQIIRKHQCIRIPVKTVIVVYLIY